MHSCKELCVNPLIVLLQVHGWEFSLVSALSLRQTCPLAQLHSRQNFPTPGKGWEAVFYSLAQISPQCLLLNCWHCREKAELKLSLCAAQLERLLLTLAISAPNESTPKGLNCLYGYFPIKSYIWEFFVFLNFHPNPPLANHPLQEPEA